MNEQRLVSVIKVAVKDTRDRAVCLLQNNCLSFGDALGKLETARRRQMNLHTFLSGRLNRNSRSKRPGLLSAGSIESSLFVAPMTTISPRLSKPSINASNVDTMELKEKKESNKFTNQNFQSPFKGNKFNTVDG